MNKSKLKCLFGYHKYTVPYCNKLEPHIQLYKLCERCMQVGYRKWSDGAEMWWEFDKNGRYTRLYKNPWGYRFRFNEEGYSISLEGSGINE